MCSACAEIDVDRYRRLNQAGSVCGTSETPRLSDMYRKDVFNLVLRSAIVRSTEAAV